VSTQPEPDPPLPDAIAVRDVLTLDSKLELIGAPLLVVELEVVGFVYNPSFFSPSVGRDFNILRLMWAYLDMLLLLYRILT
jgi:hypothetical protein